jgi:hypothetical protein
MVTSYERRYDSVSSRTQLKVTFGGEREKVEGKLKQVACSRVS